MVLDKLDTRLTVLITCHIKKNTVLCSRVFLTKELEDNLNKFTSSKTGTYVHFRSQEFLIYYSGEYQADSVNTWSASNAHEDEVVKSSEGQARGASMTRQSRALIRLNHSVFLMTAVAFAVKLL